MFRPLTLTEIEQLREQGCRAEDWTTVEVSEGFSADFVQCVTFSGKIRLGRFQKTFTQPSGELLHSGIYNARLHNCTVADDVFIANIGQSIAGYAIESDCFIYNVGEITRTAEGSFGVGVEVATVNENGGRSVPLFEGLSVQLAHILAFYTTKEDFRHRVFAKITSLREQLVGTEGVIGRGTRIVNTKQIIDNRTRENTEICGAELLQNCTIGKNSLIGSGVICRDVITSRGAKIREGAIVERCFVGEASTLEKGFSALDCLIFSNCEFANGEAVSVFAAPYTVSHHKSTLLIACTTGFSNFGSGTNMSNHAYKLGAIHQSVFERGCKFGSNSYMLSPSHIGAFSLILGTHKTNPETHKLPFSYIIENDGKTNIVPAVNLFRVGTLRDLQKWERRDKRNPDTHLDCISYELFNPLTISRIDQAIEILQGLAQENPEATAYHFGNCQIAKNAARKGISYYQEAFAVCLGEYLISEDDKPQTPAKYYPEWIDLGGMVTPKAMLEEFLSQEIDLDDAAYAEFFRNIESQRRQLYRSYIRERFSRELQDRAAVLRKYIDTLETLIKRLTREAGTEFFGVSQIGYGIDFEDERGEEFARVVGKPEANSSLRELTEELQGKIEKAKSLL